MRIIGFNLTRILVERKEAPKGKVNIDQNIDIKDVSEETIPISKDKILRITFNLFINYSEDFAKLEFEGNVMILPEKDELKKFLDSWKNKDLPEETRTTLFNFIMNKCNVKALYLEDELAIPLHVPMPRLSPQPTTSTQQDTTKK